jgi:mannosyl-3-phosphoglycerate phosphatase
MGHGGMAAFVTSKTAAEVFAVLSSLKKNGLTQNIPFISENGAAVYLPNELAAMTDLQRYPDVFKRDLPGYISLSFGQDDYLGIRNILKNEVEPNIGKIIVGFGDLSVQSLSKITGLTPLEAELSKKRNCDEPFYIENGKESDYEIARKLITDHDLYYHHGGRFAHISTKQDKGMAVKLLIDIFKQISPDLRAYGIGDAPNDISFLQVCERGFFLNGKKKYEGALPSNILQIGLSGQDGFVDAVLKIVNE